MKRTMKTKSFLVFKIVAACLLVLLIAETAGAARIKDLANIRGVRNNQLMGLGLVIGLAGTGDRSTNVFFSIQTIVNLLRKMGVTVPEREVDQLRFRNIATVIGTADLPPFARQGDHIDINVSSLGNAKSLQGGTLLMTPLKGPDGNTYAVAQGPLSIGGFSVGGQAKDVQKNHLTAGRIAGGGLVEREIPHSFNAKEEIVLALNRTDFTTAGRIADAINEKLQSNAASVMDGRTVRVLVPPKYHESTSVFVSRIEGLQVEPDTAARVILDERTGTVVMGENVQVSAVAVAHGGLFIQIREEPEVSQPAPLSRKGETVVVPRTRILVEEGEDKLLLVPKSVSLGEVVNGLNAIGVTPRDLISILQAMKAAGALHAELDII